MTGKTTACPKCRTQLDITGFKPGQRIRCGACNTVLRIPGADPATAAVPAAAPGAQATQKISLTPPPAPAPAPRPASAPAPRPAAPGPSTQRASAANTMATRQVSAPTPAPAPAEEKKDDLIGYVVANEFEITRKLGEGGYGAVYEAVDRTLHRKVAVKLMLASRASNKEYVGKFLREAQTAAKISHPNIVAIHAVGMEPGLKTHFLAMEFVEGVTLHDVLAERGPMGVEEAVDVISQCCRGLAVAHRMNIIHRDIKPGNIMITPNQGVKIADFGLAKQLDAEEQAKSMVIGTPFFMPPEQFEGKAKDGRTDIYALGVTFYYMLTMKRPFTGSTPAQILVGIMTKEPTPVNEIRPEIPEGVWKVVQRMIHRDLDQRYQDCDQILEDLSKLRKPDEGDKIFCPECGVPNEVDATKCKGCGASMREKCPVCGAEEDVGVKFCGDCGANIPLEKEVKALAQVGKAHLDKGEFGKAIERLREAQEKSPDNSGVISLLREAEGRRDGLDKEQTQVSALLAAGDFDRADQRLKAALQAYPGEDRLIALQGDLERARAAMRKGQGQFTVKALLKAHRFADAREAAERLMMSEGRTEELIDLLRQAEQSIHAVSERSEKARALDASGDSTGAMQAWKEVLEVDPEHSEAQERLRKTEEEKGAADELLRQSGAALDAGNPTDAERLLAAASGRTAEDPRVQMALRKATEAAAEVKKGVADVRAKAAAGDHAGATLALGALAGKFRGDAALAPLEEEIRASKRAGEMKEKSAKLKELVKSKRWAEVRDSAAALLHLDPDDDGARAAAEKAKGELARAADLLARADAEEKSGRFAEAEAAFEEAAEATPGDPTAEEGRKRTAEARRRLESLRRDAAAALKGKDTALAAEKFRAILELVPADPEAATELKRLEEHAAGRMRDLSDAEDLLAAGKAEEALEKAKEIGKEHPGDEEAAEIAAIAKRLLETRDGILGRVERLLAAPGREKEAARLAEVALRTLPGDAKATALLAKARAAGK